MMLHFIEVLTSDVCTSVQVRDGRVINELQY